MSAARVLIAEDDPASAALLGKYLRATGYETFLACDGSEVVTKMFVHEPDIVLLDVEMPERNGWDALREIRSCSEVPVIMVTVRSATADKVRGLEAGADDYVTKPFDLVEIEARIRAVLRRRRSHAATPGTPVPQLLTVGAMTINDGAKEVRIGDYPMHLSPKEYTLLHLLCSKPGQVFESEEIGAAVWPERTDATTEDVKTYVYLLRMRLNKARDEAGVTIPRIENVRGFGYRITKS